MPPQFNQQQAEQPKSSKIPNWIFIIIGLVLFTLGVYFIYQYLTTPQFPNPNQESPATIQARNISNWKTYRNEEYGFEFKYPEFIKITQSDNIINLNHSVDYSYTDPCDLMSGTRKLNKINDFSINIKLLNTDLQGSVENSHDIITNNKPIMQPGFVEEYKLGDLTGFKVIMGVEGCGTETYYLPLEKQKTLVVKRDLDPIGTEIIFNEIKDSLLPPKYELQILDSILSTFKFTK